MIAAANVFITAAREAGVQHVVQLSQWLPHPAHPSLHTRQLWLTEQLFAMIPGMTFTLVNPGVFADPILQLIPSAANLGTYPNPFGNLRNAPASNEDMGRCVAGALMAPERHAGKRYRPTGPDLLSVEDIARIIGDVVGRSVKVQALTPGIFLKAARAGGSPDFEVTNVRHYLAEGCLGVFAVDAPTNDVFELTGRRPESFETIARRYAAVPAARRTLTNTLKAIGDFIRIIATPPLNAQWHDRVMRYPEPVGLIPAGESRIWREQHETNSGDMYDPEQLYVALAGTQRAYYVPLMQPYMIQAANAFMVAAAAAKIEYVVQMSQWPSSASHPTAMTRQTWLVDRMFAMIPGITHTIFNPGMFADNFLRIIDFAALLDVFPVLMGDSACAPISNEDMARCAAELLTGDPAEYAGRSFHPTGTELLTGTDMARIIARVVGHGVVPVKLPFWLFRKVARMQRIDPYEIALLIQYAEDNRQGTFSYLGGVTNVMEALTGRPAESFETTARRYAALPFARQTFANRLKAMVDFARAPFVPGYDTNDLERALQIPVQSNPKYCMQDDRWKLAHEKQMSERVSLADEAHDNVRRRDFSLS